MTESEAVDPAIIDGVVFMALRRLSSVESAWYMHQDAQEPEKAISAFWHRWLAPSKPNSRLAGESGADSGARRAWRRGRGGGAEAGYFDLKQQQQTQRDAIGISKVLTIAHHRREMNVMGEDKIDSDEFEVLLREELQESGVPRSLEVPACPGCRRRITSRLCTPAFAALGPVLAA